MVERNSGLQTIVPRGTGRSLPRVREGSARHEDWLPSSLRLVRCRGMNFGRIKIISVFLFAISILLIAPCATAESAVPVAMRSRALVQPKFTLIAATDLP